MEILQYIVQHKMTYKYSLFLNIKSLKSLKIKSFACIFQLKHPVPRLNSQQPSLFLFLSYCKDDLFSRFYSFLFTCI